MALLMLLDELRVLPIVTFLSYSETYPPVESCLKGDTQGMILRLHELPYTCITRGYCEG